MRLLIGMPALNEEATIVSVIGAIPKAIEGVDEVRIVVVDDGSTDDTATLASGAGAHVIRHPQNRGVGAAFQSMVRHAIVTGADIMVTIDSDGQFDPNHIPKLISPIIDGRALVTTASRFLDPALVPKMPWIKKWGNRRVANLVNMLTGQRFADVSCGFRAYAREAMLQLTVYHQFTYTHETLIDLATKQVPIAEVPLVVRGVREVGESRVASSIPRYAWRTATIMLRTYRDQQPLRLSAWIVAPISLMGFGLLGWSLAERLATGAWLKWAAFAGAAALSLSIVTLFLGFMVDLTTRLRRNQEEILYWLRKQADSSQARAKNHHAKGDMSAIRAAGNRQFAPTVAD